MVVVVGAIGVRKLLAKVSPVVAVEVEPVPRRLARRIWLILLLVGRGRLQPARRVRLAGGTGGARHKVASILAEPI